MKRILFSLVLLFAPAIVQAQQLLQPSDFHYLGAVQMGGNSYACLTYRPSTKTFFTIPVGGQRPFVLHEVSLDPKAGFKLVKNWGPLDPTGTLLKIVGSGQTILDMTYVSDKCLIVNPAQTYINYANQPFLWSFDLTSGKAVLNGGPWNVPAKPGSFVMSGSTMPAPAEIRALGFDTMMNSLLGGAVGTWGLGATVLTLPTPEIPANSVLEAHQIVFWPGIEHVINLKENWRYRGSAFPRPAGNVAGKIFGNDDVNGGIGGVAQGGSATTIVFGAGTVIINAKPYETTAPIGWYVTNLATGEQQPITAYDAATLTATVSPWTMSPPAKGAKYNALRKSYQATGYLNPVTGLTEEDAVGPGATIELMDANGVIRKHALFYVFVAAEGWQWYGNPTSHDDETPAGVTYNNDPPSLLDQTKPTVAANNSRGGHAEQFRTYWMVVDPSEYAASLKMVLAGTSTVASQQILPSATGDYTALCDGVPLPHMQGSAMGKLGQMQFVPSADGSQGTLYVLSPSGGANAKGIVNVFQVGP